MSKVKDRGNFENGKRKDTQDIKGNSYKSICRLLCRNFADQEIVRQSIQNTWERKASSQAEDLIPDRLAECHSTPKVTLLHIYVFVQPQHTFKSVLELLIYTPWETTLPTVVQC